MGVMILWGKINRSFNIELHFWIASYETLSKILYMSIYRISNQTQTVIS